MENNDLNKLLKKLRKEDQQYVKVTKVLGISFVICIPIYITILIDIYTNTGEITQLAVPFSFLLASMIFVIILRKNYRQYKSVDYSLPTLLMLKATTKRYNPFQLKNLWVVIAAALPGIASAINPPESISSTQILIEYFGGLAIAFIIGIVIWLSEHRPLINKASKLISGIEEETEL